MAEDTEDQQAPSNSSPAVTPASNQNLIIGIVMGAVVLLLLLLVITQQLDKKDDSDPHKEELAKLEKEFNEKKARNEAMRYQSLGGIGENPDVLITQIKSDTEALGRLVTQNAGNAAALRAAQDNAASLGNQNRDLQNQLSQYRAAASQAASLQQQLTAANQRAAGMVDKLTADSLRDQLAEAKNERDRLQTELTQLRATQGDMIDRNTYMLVKSELDELRKANALLRAENQKLITELNGAKLFVSGDDLSPKTVKLYRELKRIEVLDHRTRRQEYRQFSTQLNANISEEITFKTGSAQVATEHESHLKDLALKAPANAFFLVVGYASKSGDSKTNEELSSRRATRVASMVNYLKKEGQEVQAVYLGEGKRFGPSDPPNQVCEVWEIRP